MDSVIFSEGFRKYNAIFYDHGKNIIKQKLLSNDISTQTGKESGRFCEEPQNRRKETKWHREECMPDTKIPCTCIRQKEIPSRKVPSKNGC